MVTNFLEHHHGATLDGKAGDSGANRRESDRLESLFRCAPQRIARRVAQRRLAHAPAKAHRSRMNYVTRLELPSSGDYRFADRNRSQLIALGLDRRPALGAD